MSFSGSELFRLVMHRFTYRILLLLLFSNCIGFAATVCSPDGNIVLTFKIRDIAGFKNCPIYSVSYKSKPVLVESRLGFELEDAVSLYDDFKIMSEESSHQDTTWRPVYGERSIVQDQYNQVSILLQQDGADGYKIMLDFRCYNSGAAFRYSILSRNAAREIIIKNERTEFRFLQDHYAWCTTTAQGVYSKLPISKIPAQVERPLTIESEDDIYIALAEANLVAYARMKFSRSPDDSLCVTSQLSGSVFADLPLVTPWRVIMLAETPGELFENNDIFLNLNEPCRIENTSWIKPGKVIREVTLTTAGGKACVDFAARRNMQYVEFDAGWYGHEYDDSSNATSVNVDPKRSPGPLDLHEVIRYASKKNIGILLYVNRRALELQLDDILPLYRQWGIKGVKYGFVQVGSQEWTSWLHEAVRKAARYQLMVAVHDEYRPTGYSRTYPNLMTQEGIAGDETRPSNELTLTILFTRMLAGAGDNTICYYDNRVDDNASHAYQLAKSVCLYSPWQFLYWYDRPKESPRKKGGAGGQKNVISEEPELEFFDHVPTVWDETRVIHGSISEYAVIARRSDENWFVGCMNSGLSRSLDIPLDFLKPDKKYIAFVYSDDDKIETKTRVRIDRKAVESTSILNVNMTAKGGQAMRIVPAG